MAPDRSGQRVGYRPAGVGGRLRDQHAPPGYLYLDRKGHRFVDETRVEAHTTCQLTANYDPATFDYPRLPCFVVFDEENLNSGPLGISMFSYNVVRLGYKWSEDNRIEIDRGWIVRAETLDQLAQTLRIPGGGLALDRE